MECNLLNLREWREETILTGSSSEPIGVDGSETLPVCSNNLFLVLRKRAIDALQKESIPPACEDCLATYLAAMAVQRLCAVLSPGTEINPDSVFCDAVPFVAHRVSSSSIERLRLWKVSGTVFWSNLIGVPYSAPLPPEGYSALPLLFNVSDSVIVFYCTSRPQFTVFISCLVYLP